MTLLSHLDGGVLVIQSVGDHSMEDGLREMLAAIDRARTHFQATGDRPSLLIDLRESEENKEPGELRNVAEFLAKNLDVLSGRIAVIAERGLRFGLARMFAVYGERVGLTTVVFVVEGAARAWLQKGDVLAATEEA